jgi:hypothetical protein
MSAPFEAVAWRWPVFAYDAIGRSAFAPNAMTQVEDVCRLLDTAVALKALAPLDSPGGIAASVSIACRAFWGQQRLAEGGAPAVPFMRTAPIIAKLHLLLEDWVDMVAAAEDAAGGDPARIAAPPLGTVVRTARLIERASVLKWLAESLLDDGLRRAIAGAVRAVVVASVPGRRSRYLAANAPVIPSPELKRAVADLLAVLQRVVRELILPALAQAEQRDRAVIEVVLTGMGLIIEDGSVTVGQPAMGLAS